MKAVKTVGLLVLVGFCASASLQAAVKKGKASEAAKANPQHIHVENLRKPSSPHTGPCAEDLERIKDLAADLFSRTEIDSDHHKIEATAESFTSDEVWTTAAGDASVLNLSGKGKVGGTKRELKLKAQAVCSPGEGRYELMNTSYSN